MGEVMHYMRPTKGFGSFYFDPFYQCTSPGPSEPDLDPARQDGRSTPAASSPGSAADGRLATDKVNNLALLRLMERTGYNIIQENGQRKYGGPPPNWQGPPPAKGSEVFVGKIPRDLFEDELAPVFERVGKIYEVRLMMDFSGTNRGYAFVMFSTPAEASQAVRQLNNYEIRKGRYIGVVKSVDNCRLFVGGLPKNKVRDEIFEEMSKVTDGVVDVIVYSSVTDKSKSRGFAFVEYKNHKAAAMARRKLIPGRIQLWGQTIAVDWAEPEPDVDEETMSKVTVLYVRNLLLSTTEDQIRDAFSRAADGGVERVKKLRDFAFVHFSNRDKAARAQEKLDHTELDGSLVEVTWAKPIDKSRHDRYKAAAHCPPAVYQPPPHGFVGDAPFYVPTGLGSPGSPGSALFRSPNKQRNRGAAGVRNRSFLSPSAAAARAAGGHRKPVEMRAFFDYVPDMEFVLTNPCTLKPMRNAAQILVDLCINNKWGEPQYQLLSTSKQTPQADTVQLFMYKVTIPTLPPEYNTFQGSRLSLYPEEAKVLAAETALSQLGVPLENGEGPGSPPQAMLPRPMVPNGAFNAPSPNGSPTGFNAFQFYNMYNPCPFGKMMPFEHHGMYDGYGMGNHHAHPPAIY
ncbi:APOBEC1 complementation factor-like isoform X1 [Amphibalanus amphitrite]|uniref:APOBEC1 complementation factor-like isoform X1 n=1 Tax=Amphibalanus amphitrite TaxID=1232801 RepID=UPI001C916E0B|nr:APOBEC1 complementation factor-like isoform X1 [Amphibalanus amphitrite]